MGHGQKIHTITGPASTCGSLLQSNGPLFYSLSPIPVLQTCSSGHDTAMRAVRFSYRPIFTRLSLQRLEPSILTGIRHWHAFSDAVLTSQDMMKNMPASLTANDEAKRPNPILSCYIDLSSTHPLRHTKSALTHSRTTSSVRPTITLMYAGALAHCPGECASPSGDASFTSPRETALMTRRTRSDKLLWRVDAT